MFAGRRAHRAYRVYAEDDFLGADDPDAETGVLGDATLDGVHSYTDGVRSYTAAPRGLPRPLGGRVGLAIVVLVAMAVSALVAHALRVGLGGGGEVTRTSIAPSMAATTYRGARVTAHGGPAVGDAHDVRRHASGFAAARLSHDGRDRVSRVATVRTRGSRPDVSAGLEDPGRASAAVAGDGRTDVASASSAAAVPEFGFER